LASKTLVKSINRFISFLIWKVKLIHIENKLDILGFLFFNKINA